jgi:hypothetical protein
VDILVRSRTPLGSVTVTAEVKAESWSPAGPVALSPRGTALPLPLPPVVTLTGRRGVEETLYRQRIEVEVPASTVLRLTAAGS